MKFLFRLTLVVAAYGWIDECYVIVRKKTHQSVRSDNSLVRPTFALRAAAAAEEEEEEEKKKRRKSNYVRRTKNERMLISLSPRERERERERE